MFLPGQLFLQQRALGIAHLYSVREELFASEKRCDDIAFKAVSDESLATLWVRGGEDLSNLDDVAHYRFRTYLRAYFLSVRTDWALRRGSDGVSSFETLLRALFSAKGRRGQYAGDLLGNLLSEPELLEIADRIYEEFEGAPVSVTTEGITQNLPTNIPRSYGA
jgi:hypothetical protein